MGVTHWPRSLAWSEFRDISSRPEGVKEDAQIHVVIPALSGIQVVREGNALRIQDVEIAVTVDRTDTWVVGSRKSDKLLAHEQGHFDITGLVTWEFYRRIMAARASTSADLQRLLQSAQERAQRKLAALSGSDSGDSEGKYDTETAHGANDSEQTRWNDLIRDCITHNYRALPEP